MKTPLVELETVGTNRIFAKVEYMNPGGNHYDRVFPPLLDVLEQQNLIEPGRTRLVETTSGNAGISFAQAASRYTQAGLAPIIFTHGGTSTRRLALMREAGAEVVVTPKEAYIYGMVTAMRKYLREHHERDTNGRRVFYCPNHSRSDIALDALRPIAREAMETGGEFTTFIGAAGGGLTLRAIAEELRAHRRDTHIITFEPSRASLAYQLKYGSQDESPAAHELFGTGGWGIEFPHLEQAIVSLVDEVQIVTPDEWRHGQEELARRGYPAGRTSGAAFTIAQQFCKGRHNERVLIVLYDRADLY